MHNQRRAVKGWRTVNVWPIKGPLIVVAGLLGFFDHAIHWGRAPIAAGLAMIIPILGFRDYWGEVRFWITIAVLGVLQVPLGIGVRPLMEQLKFPFMLTFGIIDCAVMVALISWVCSAGTGEGK